MERARAVLAEDRILRLAPHEVNQLERAESRLPGVQFPPLTEASS
jgi:hypothetical protein